MGILLAFSFSIALGIVYAVATGATADDDRTLVQVLVGLVGIWIGLGGTVLFASRNKGTGNLVKDFGLRWKFPGDALLGLLLGATAQFLTFIVTLPLTLSDPDFSEKFAEPARELSSTASGWRIVPLAIALCLLAPLFEELFFRGLVLRALLKRWGPVPAIAFSSLLFAAIHLELLQAVALALVGVVMATATLKTGRLGPAVIGHAVFNTVTVVTLFTTS